MILRCLLPATLVILTAALPARAEIKFVRPEEPSPSQSPAPDLGALDVAEIFRGIDLLRRVSNRASHGRVIASLVNDHAQDDIDGTPGITDADRALAARVEISKARARAAQPLAEHDLDADGVVTKAELLIIGATRTDSMARRQGLGSGIELTRAQRDTIAADYAAGFLGRDLDGDDRVTLDEVMATIANKHGGVALFDVEQPAVRRDE